MTEVKVGWSGLPLIWCPKCKKERIIERTSRHGQVKHNGKVFYRCMSCDFFKWEDDYKPELVKAIQELEILQSDNAKLRSIVDDLQLQIDAGNQEAIEELEILQSENAQLRSIIADQQVQIEALVGKQEDEEPYVDSDIDAEAFSRICRLQDVAEGRADPSEGGPSYECDCDCPDCCEPDCECIMYHQRSP